MFEEVSPGQYAHNANSSILLVPEAEALISMWYVFLPIKVDFWQRYAYVLGSGDDLCRACAALPATMHESGFKIRDDSLNTAFSKAFQSKSLPKYLVTIANN